MGAPTEVKWLGEQKPAPNNQQNTLQSMIGGYLFIGVLVGCYALIHWLAPTLHFSWSWWGMAYVMAGAVVGVLYGIAMFFGLWIWAAGRYGAIGFLFGWLPSSIAAVVGGYVLVIAWLPALLIGGIMAAR